MRTGESLAVLVRSWRKRALLTQEQLAVRTGLGVRTIRRLERDPTCRPRTESVRLLAAALGLTAVEAAELVTAARMDLVEVAQTRVELVSGQAPVPRQLPIDVAGFAGRAAELYALDCLLCTDSPSIVVITGTAGVGKTALAVHWAQRVASGFPGGQLYVNLRGFDPVVDPVEPAVAVRGFLDAIGVPPDLVPTDPDAQAALFRSQLAGSRTLILLDNARDCEQARPLLPGTGGCVVIVTSRDQLIGLSAAQGAATVSLDVLAAAEARDLLHQRIGRSRSKAEPAAVDEIIDRCARLPLALGVVAARAAASPRLALGDLAAELRSTTLDSFDIGDSAADLRTAFSWSYRNLSPEAARLFRLWGLHPGPELTGPVATSLLGCTAGRALAELTRANLLTEHTTGRYGSHDLLRAYSRERAEAEQTADERDDARVRLMSHYRCTARAAAVVLDPRRDRFGCGPVPAGVLPERIADPPAALRWFDTEHAVLVGLCQADSGGPDVVELAWYLSDHLDRRGHWHDWVVTQEAALRSAEAIGDAALQALAHRGLAAARFRTGGYDQAYRHMEHALELLGSEGDPTDRARLHINLSAVHNRRERYADAVAQAKSALELYRLVGDRAGEGDALGALGWSYASQGEHKSAVESCTQALVVHRELGNLVGEAACLDSLGLAYHRLADHDQAVRCYEQSVAICRALHDRYYEALGLVHLGDTRLSAGRPDAARSVWRQAAEILDELHHPDAAEPRHRLATLT